MMGVVLPQVSKSYTRPVPAAPAWQNMWVAQTHELPYM